MKRLFSITRKDLEVQTFRSGGPGGQHQNKTSSGVRIVHRESGAIGESREDRSQHRNKKIALQRLVQAPKFKVWHSRKVHEILSGESIAERVEKAMSPKHLKIETREQGKWGEIEDETIL